jgi:hypothetical protein
MKADKRDTKKLFRKKGTCSQTYYYLLNREFGHNNDLYERASDPLVGGILQLGHQCGLLMGSTLAVGTASYHRFKEPEMAIKMAILGSKKVRDSFEEKADSVNCREITGTDFSKKIQFAKYMVFKAWSCFKLADRWTEDAIRSARESLDDSSVQSSPDPISCASEVARKMGASDEEIITVSGFAGGLGLGGDACGALCAAIWLKSIEWCKENPGKSAFSNEYASNILFTFDDATNSKFLCREICGREFESIEDHSTYIREGGCSKLIETLSRSW